MEDDIKTLLLLYVPRGRIADIVLKFPEHEGDRLSNVSEQGETGMMVYYIDHWSYHKDQVTFLMKENIVFVPIPIMGPRPAFDFYMTKFMS